MTLLNMNGFGIYIWSAYGITFLSLGINLFFALREKKQIKKIILQRITSKT